MRTNKTTKKILAIALSIFVLTNSLILIPSVGQAAAFNPDPFLNPSSLNDLLPNINNNITLPNPAQGLIPQIPGTPTEDLATQIMPLNNSSTATPPQATDKPHNVNPATGYLELENKTLIFPASTTP